MSDRQPLINSEETPPSPSYGADDEKEDDEDAKKQKHMREAAGGNGPKSKKQRGMKRDRLTRDPSLDKVDEEQEIGKESKKSSGGLGCSDLSFGVKSYLHNFYDSRFYKDPNVYEDDDDYRYLLHPYPRKRRCTSIWWKIFVWIGANFLIFGIIGVLVGYLVPEREVFVAAMDNMDVIDKDAVSYNSNLYVFKLVGLILFCIGGLTLTVALLFPSFLYQYFDDEKREKSFKVKASGGDEVNHPPGSPLEKNIPVSGVVTNVQPERKGTEAIVTKEGMVPYKD